MISANHEARNRFNEHQTHRNPPADSTSKNHDLLSYVSLHHPTSSEALQKRQQREDTTCTYEWET